MLFQETALKDFTDLAYRQLGGHLFLAFLPYCFLDTYCEAIKWLDACIVLIFEISLKCKFVAFSFSGKRLDKRVGGGLKTQWASGEDGGISTVSLSKLHA